MRTNCVDSARFGSVLSRLDRVPPRVSQSSGPGIPSTPPETRSKFAKMSPHGNQDFSKAIHLHHKARLLVLGMDRLQLSTNFEAKRRGTPTPVGGTLWVLVEGTHLRSILADWKSKFQIAVTPRVRILLYTPDSLEYSGCQNLRKPAQGLVKS